MGHADTKMLTKAINAFITEWGTLLNVGLGIAALLGLLAFGYSITLLIMNADNPQGRQDAISKIIKSGITTACIGGFWTIVWLVYFAFI